MIPPEHPVFAMGKKAELEIVGTTISAASSPLMWPDRKGRSSISWNRLLSKHDNLGRGSDT
jgi:hypothetical protein